MNYKIGNVYHGFKLDREENVVEINSISRVFTHEKTGAKLLHLENDDSNKVFAIGFKTPPSDDTGVAHILEHSVLCGSRKFPTKEPFVELIKGSLNTFLNAMTFSDKTIYPLASKNEKDFFNLMDVYLDAVFYPNIYNTKEILMQEGWHYELENAEDDLTYKGVVYNEMKGAFSSPDGILMRKIQESLFKNNTYGFESGGDPDAIPDLTSEEFLGFHSKYYHPSNSYIFLYGDGDLDQRLKFINDNYLINFEKTKIDSEIKPEEPFNEIKEAEYEYSISREDDENEKTFMALNFVTGKSTDDELYLSLSTLEYLLLETQGAPLKQALLDANLGKDVYGSLDNSILQPVFSIVLKNTDSDKREKFIDVVYTTLRNLVDNGIDKKLIEACVNITEFKLREADFQGMPKGLFYYMTAMDSWLHGGDPLTHLRYEKGIEKMKSGLTSNYFENLIEKYLLNNNHGSILVLSPKKGLADEKDEKLNKKLQDYKANLSMDEIKDIVNETRNLIKRQTTPDSDEILETIPVLSIEDIEEKIEELQIEETSTKGIKLLHHDVFTSKIAYLSFMFNSKVLNQEDIPYISLLSTLMGKVNTKTYSYSDLSNEILINTGGMYFKNEIYGDSKDTLKYSPYFEAHCSVVVDKLPKALNILSDIIKNTVFDDKKRIRDLIRVLISRMEMKFMDRGHQVATTRLGSYFSPAYSYIESTSGYDFYRFLKEFENSFDEKIDGFIEKLEVVRRQIFNKNNMIVTVIGKNEEVEAVDKNMNIVLDVLSDEHIELKDYKFIEDNKKEGMLTPSNVQYVAKGYNYKRLGYKFTGKLLVLKTIIGMDYLWNKVRVQGGAYGAFANIVRSGNLMFASYRDPNIRETLKAYDETAKYVADFTTTDREMLKYIIGTISELDMPLTPSMAGDTAISYYIRGISNEDRQRERTEILNTNVKDINGFSKLISDVMEKDFIVVLGNDSKIKNDKELFKELKNTLS
ncbi:MAG: insulinase family protein [Clostridium sp.]|uniref:insulinase family protein n=1 Tax=Clostridium sp. TaxID=1506 RepID=UPI00305F3914